MTSRLPLDVHPDTIPSLYLSSVIYREHYTLYGLPQTGQQYDMMAYLNIFTTESWALILSILVVLIVLGFLLNNSSDGTLRESAWNSIACALTALIQQSFSAKEDTWAQKVFLFTSRMTFFLIFSLYGALLTSSMTFRPQALISSVQDAIDLVRLLFRQKNDILKYLHPKHCYRDCKSW